MHVYFFFGDPLSKSEINMKCTHTRGKYGI